MYLYTLVKCIKNEGKDINVKLNSVIRRVSKMDQDDLEDEVFTKTLLAHVDLVTTSSRQLFEWQRRYIQTELIYAIAFVLSILLCLAKRKGRVSEKKVDENYNRFILISMQFLLRSRP